MYIERILPVVIQGLERLHCASALKCVSLLLVISDTAEKDLIENDLIRLLGNIEFNTDKCTDYYRFRFWCVLNCLGSIAAAGDERDVDRILESDVWKHIVDIMREEVLQYGIVTEIVYLVNNMVCSSSKDQVRDMLLIIQTLL